MVPLVRPLARDEIAACLPALARLRIAVFRAWPYLYDGDAAYEASYLAAYAQNPGAVVIGAFDGDTMVGAATASPLTAHHDEFAAPLAAAGFDPTAFFYFGESVLMPAYRGTGIGVRFFAERERAAREQGFERTLFSAVIRPDDHPMKPAQYVPLDSFWRKRGYAPIDGLTTRFSWRDIGDADETDKPMAFWHKRLP